MSAPSTPSPTFTFPTWLNQGYLEDAIRNKYKDSSVKITKFEPSPATSVGDNYASVLFRIGIEFESDKCKQPQRTSFILKTSFQQLPNTEPIEALELYNIYQREMVLYDCIFLKFQNILRNIGCVEDLVPDTIKVDRHCDGLLFEDLKLRNYITLERRVGLDIEHTELLLRKLAKFHAASIIFNEKERQSLEKFDYGIFNKHTRIYAPFFTSYLETCGETVSEWKGFEQLGEKLIKLKDKVMDYGEKVFEVNPNHLNVLAHGDLWKNNVMFQYDNSGKVKDVIILDFQFTCWASPAVDLHYLFRTSLIEDIQEEQLKDFVERYHSSLSEILTALGYRGKLPTFPQFWMEFTEKSFYAVTSAFVVQPLQINEKPDQGDAFALLGNDEQSKKFRRMIYSNPRVHRTLKKLLPIFDKQGLLD